MDGSKFKSPFWTRPSDNVWKTGLSHRFPFLAGLALLLALGSVAGIVAVLRSSDGVPVTNYVNVSWQGSPIAVQPQVLLSILTTMANISLTVALSEAATISWWLKAIGGTSIRDLHTSWAMSKSVFPRYRNFTRRSWLGPAALLCSLVAIDGPLLQQASIITVASVSMTTNITLPLPPRPFVQGSSSYDMGPSTYNRLYTPVFASVVQAHSNRAPIVIPNSGCEGDCHMLVQAAGFDISCKTTDYPVNSDCFAGGTLQHADLYHCHNIYSASVLDNVYDVPTGPNHPELWIPNVDAPPPPAHFLQMFLSTISKTTKGLQGPYQQNNCTLTENISEYNITMTNDTVMDIEPWMPGRNSTIMLVPTQSRTLAGGSNLRASTMRGFSLALSQKFSANVTGEGFMGVFSVSAFYCDPFDSECYDNRLGKAAIYVDSPVDEIGTANITWRDPMPDMLKTAQELSLRHVLATATQEFTLVPNATYQDFRQSGLCSDSEASPNRNAACVSDQLAQRVLSTQKRDFPVYRTNWSWAAGGLSLMLITIFSIFPVLFGFWRLGRHFSDSPIEIAKAFGAPLLSDGEPNAPVAEILRGTGATRVRYGVVLENALIVPVPSNTASQIKQTTLHRCDNNKALPQIPDSESERSKPQGFRPHKEGPRYSFVIGQVMAAEKQRSTLTTTTTTTTTTPTSLSLSKLGKRARLLRFSYVGDVKRPVHGERF